AAHVDALAPRAGFDLGDARVLRTGLKQHLAHVAGVVLDSRGHGVDAGDPLVFFAHGKGTELGAGDWGLGTGDWGKVCGSGFSRELLLWLLPLRRQGEAGRGWSRFAMIQKAPLPNPPLPSQGRELEAFG